MNRPWAVACTASVFLHAAVGWVMLHRASSGDAIEPGARPPTLTVEFVDQVADLESAAAQAAAAPPSQPRQTPEAAPQPTTAPAPEQMPTPLAEAGQDAVPPPPEPGPPAPQPASPLPPPVPQAAPTPQRVNLDGGEQDRPSLLVTGNDVVPPRPDDTIRNRPPAYPADAARRHAQGTVGLVVHVTAAGIPGWVDVAESSGDASLDEAARDAVALWRFRPATSGGLPVPFDFAYSIRFTLGSDRRINGQDRPRYNPGR